MRNSVLTSIRNPLAMLLHQSPAASMSNSKTPSPDPDPAPARPANVIPFARPRAIAAMPAEFSPPKPAIGAWNKPLTPQRPQPTGGAHRGPQPPPLPPAAAMVSVTPIGNRAPALARALPSIVRGGGGALAAAKVLPPIAASEPVLVPTAPPAPARDFDKEEAPTIASLPTFTNPFDKEAPTTAEPPSFTNPFDKEAATIAAPPSFTFPVDKPSMWGVFERLRRRAPDLDPRRWATFEKLGMRAPKLDPRKWSKQIVTTYRMLGFSILTIIVIILVGYIAETTFFYLSDSWIVPLAISPTDEKVVSLQAQLTERLNVRDRTAADLADAERGIAVQQAFQSEFQKAIQSDLAGRKAALDRMHELASVASSTRASIRRSNDAYAEASSRRMSQEYAAGLIDRQGMLSGKFQLAQISTSNLTLAERQAEYETRAADLDAQTRSLEALLANTKVDSPMSYDVLRIKQEYEKSRLETQKAIQLRDALRASLTREDELVKSLQNTSYLRALSDHAQVAFVPYGNMHTIDKGTSLYACRLGMIFCHKVGEVLEVLPGEVLFKHPKRDKQLRGQMIELKLEDGVAATDDVLFVGGRPLLI
jgi:hypothetical protein